MNRGQAILLVGVLVAGCDYHDDKVSSDLSPVSREVSFAEVSAKVLQPSCVGCHTSINPQLADYSDASKVAGAIHQAVFVDKTMPKVGQLSGDQMSLLLAWLDQGAPEGAPGPAPLPAPSTSPGGRPMHVVWTDVKAKVIDVACAACHFANNPDSISDFTVEDNVKADFGSIVGLAVEDMMPPPDKGKPISVDQKRLLTEWWIAGLPDAPKTAPLR